MLSVYQAVLTDLKRNDEVPDNILQLLRNKLNGVESLFSGLSTAYQQKRYFKDEFHKIVHDM